MVQQNNEPEEELEEEDLGQQVDRLLEQGYSQKEIREQGFSPSLIRQRVRRKVRREGKQPPENKTNDNHKVALTIKEKETVLPEWLEGQVAEIFDGSISQQRAFQAGMAIPLLGLRLFAESMKPFGDLMKLWQVGQAEAARAASGGSEEVAQQTISQAMPYMERMVKEASISASPNPMAGLFARILEQPMTLMFNSLFGSMFPGVKQQAPGQSVLPTGWIDKSGEQK